jgi:hypothetical protein
MKKQLAIIYQFLLKNNVRRPYINTVLMSTFFIMVHLFLVVEIFMKVLKYEGYDYNKFVLPISLVVISLILFLYKRPYLLQFQFTPRELKKKTINMLLYLVFIFTSLMAVQYF